MRKLYRIIFLASLLIPTAGKAQTADCDPEQTIAQATEEFNAGHFYSVPSILNECLKSFNRDQRQRAHLLLTQTYLLLDDPIGAQRSYLEILTANPEFVPDEKLHSIDVVYLSKRFTATPRFSWFVGAGSNVSPIKVIYNAQMTEVAPGQLQEKDRYSFRLGYHFGAGAEYSYSDNLKLRLEGNFFQMAYRLETSYQFGEDMLTFTERQTWMNVPVYVCYSDNIGRYRPYGYGGLSVSRLFTSKASIIDKNLTSILSGGPGEGGETESLEEASPDIDFLQRRNRLNRSIIFGAGIKYKLGLDFVFVDLRYSAGLRNIVNRDNAFFDHANNSTSPEFVESGLPAKYRYQDDYFRIDNLAITIGFLRPLYKPRELKNARTKGILRKMKRGK